jgi:hypothetical protein
MVEASPITKWQGYNSTNSLGDAKRRMDSLLRNHVKVEVANMICINV